MVYDTDKTRFTAVSGRCQLEESGGGGGGKLSIPDRSMLPTFMSEALAALVSEASSERLAAFGTAEANLDAGVSGPDFPEGEDVTFGGGYGETRACFLNAYMVQKRFVSADMPEVSAVPAGFDLKGDKVDKTALGDMVPAASTLLPPGTGGRLRGIPSVAAAADTVYGFRKYGEARGGMSGPMSVAGGHVGRELSTWGADTGLDGPETGPGCVAVKGDIEVDADASMSETTEATYNGSAAADRWTGPAQPYSASSGADARRHRKEYIDMIGKAFAGAADSHVEGTGRMDTSRPPRRDSEDPVADPQTEDSRTMSADAAPDIGAVGDLLEKLDELSGLKVLLARPEIHVSGVRSVDVSGSCDYVYGEVDGDRGGRVRKNGTATTGDTGAATLAEALHLSVSVAADDDGSDWYHGIYTEKTDINRNLWTTENGCAQENDPGEGVPGADYPYTQGRMTEYTSKNDYETRRSASISASFLTRADRGFVAGGGAEIHDHAGGDAGGGKSVEYVPRSTGMNYRKSKGEEGAAETGPAGYMFRKATLVLVLRVDVEVKTGHDCETYEWSGGTGPFDWDGCDGQGYAPANPKVWLMWDGLVYPPGTKAAYWTVNGGAGASGDGKETGGIIDRWTRRTTFRVETAELEPDDLHMRVESILHSTEAQSWKGTDGLMDRIAEIADEELGRDGGSWVKVKDLAARCHRGPDDAANASADLAAAWITTDGLGREDGKYKSVNSGTRRASVNIYPVDWYVILEPDYDVKEFGS